MATKMEAVKAKTETEAAEPKKKGAIPMNIKPPNMQMVVVNIEGIAPYVQNKFSKKARDQMKAKQEKGDKSKVDKAREAKDFQACYEAAKHVSTEGWCGIPAAAFRNAMVSACRVVNFQMVRAKLSVFVEADGVDATDGTMLVRITKGEPTYFEACVRNDSGVVDIRARPMWREGWRATVRITYDADMFSTEDVVNLFARAGMQVGVGEGRPDSKESCGMGWGLWRCVKD